MASSRSGLGRGIMSAPQDALPPRLRSLLKRLVELGITREFYLAGGTGLALHLNHRRSVDLDWFSRTNRLDADGRRALLAQLRQLPQWRVIESKDGTIHGRVGLVRVSFFWYPQPLVSPLVRKERVPVAAVEDIGLMKLGAIIGRGSRKDFIDVYTICQSVPLPRLLALAGKKFRDVQDFPWQALKALSFFEDAEREPPAVMVSPVSWDQVKAFFIRAVRLLARQDRRISRKR